MPARLVVPKTPRRPSVPPALPFNKSHLFLTRSESTLTQVLIPIHFNSSKINTYKKPGEGVPPLYPKVLQLVTPSAPPLFARNSPFASIPFRITSFAHPYHLTSIESHLYKKQGRGWGPLRSPLATGDESLIANSFGIRTYPKRTWKSRRIRTYGKTRGEGSAIFGGRPDLRLCSFRQAMVSES